MTENEEILVTAMTDTTDSAPNSIAGEEVEGKGVGMENQVATLPLDSDGRTEVAIAEPVDENSNKRK